jgi:hypothetical protein
MLASFEKSQGLRHHALQFALPLTLRHQFLRVGCELPAHHQGGLA